MVRLSKAFQHAQISPSLQLGILGIIEISILIYFCIDILHGDGDTIRKIHETTNSVFNRYYNNTEAHLRMDTLQTEVLIWACLGEKLPYEHSSPVVVSRSTLTGSLQDLM